MNPRQWRSFFARTISYFLFQGCLKCFGVILEGTVEVTGSNVAMVSWAFMILQGVALLVGPVIGWLMDIFSYRFLGTSGGFLVGAGFIYQAYFANSLLKLMIANIATGFGFGMIILVTTVDLGEIYGTTFGLALAISTIFSSVSMMVMPIILDRWLQTYGLSAAVALLGALMWNCVPSGLLLFKKNGEGKTSRKALPKNSDDGDNDLGSPPSKQEALGLLAKDSDLSQRRNILVAHPALSFAILTRLFNTIIVFAWAVFMVPFGVEKGYHPSTAVLLSSAGGAGMLVGRLGCIVVFYFDWMSNVPSLVSGVIINFAVMLGFHFTADFLLLSAFAFIAGILASFYATWVQAFTKHIVCDRHFKSATALASLVNGVGMVATGLVAGLIHGIRNSYNDVFIFLSLMALCQMSCLVPTVWLLRPITGDCVV